MTVRRRLLLISLHFPPSAASGAFRAVGLARHLPTCGWDVCVVAAPSTPFEPVDTSVDVKLPSATCVHYVRYPESRWARLAAWALQRTRAIDSKAVWCPAAWVACRRLTRSWQPDMILTSGPPHSVHLLGRRLAGKYKLPWIADFRDPWSTGALSSEAQLDPWASYWERLVFKGASAIVANAPGACDILKAGFPQFAGKFVTVTNGFDWPPIDIGTAAAAESSQETISIVHCGELYCGRDPKPFLAAFKDVRSARNGNAVRADFYGRYDRFAGIEDEIGRLSLQCSVQLHGQVSSVKALHSARAASILLMIDTPGRKNGVPAKLYEYLGAGRPVLALAEPDSDVAWVLRTSGVLHQIASPTDACAIRRALHDLVDAVECGVPVVADREALASFSRAATARALATLMETRLIPRHRASLGAASATSLVQECKA